MGTRNTSKKNKTTGELSCNFRQGEVFSKQGGSCGHKKKAEHSGSEMRLREHYTIAPD